MRMMIQTIDMCLRVIICKLTSNHPGDICHSRLSSPIKSEFSITTCLVGVANRVAMPTDGLLSSRVQRKGTPATLSLGIEIPITVLLLDSVVLAPWLTASEVKMVRNGPALL
ncbi:hypothetical protein CEXT_486851 [Caerostris extrusa]|uniref:Uncharacterized protein n=1 Tax=Caerostris extrusa TaxID=172846 RepID=A0AAV4W9I1_CAEEX|nr:hypothetical protein CEXT_486851 [Caerostris extrusa]